MRTRYIIAAANDIEALISLADALAATLPEGTDDSDRAMRGIDAARVALLDPATESPFLRYREVILGHYSTAYRLQALTLHLWNSNNKVAIADLFGNADARHTRIALEMIASYARHGESDPDFMRLADEIRDRQKAVQAEESLAD